MVENARPHQGVISDDFRALKGVFPLPTSPSCRPIRAAFLWGPAIPADYRVSLNGGYAMRFDLTPFQRSTIGFDRLFSLLDQAGGLESAPTYPPYNFER